MKSYSQSAGDPDVPLGRELEEMMISSRGGNARMYLETIVQAVGCADNGDIEDREYLSSPLFREHARLAGLDPDAVRLVLMRRYRWAR